MKERIDMRILWVFVAASLLMAMPAYAGGARPECGPGDKGAKMMQKMAADLGLTAEQQAQMKAIRESQMARMKDLQTKSLEVKEAMRAELDKPETDAVKVSGYVDRLTAIYREKTQNRVDGVVATKKVLTREQFAKLNEKMKERMDNWKKKGGMRRGPGGHHGDEAGE